MTTLNVKIENEDQGRILMSFLNSLDYEYDLEETEELDETAYLLSNDAMREHLAKSVDEAKEGKVKAIAIDDLWK
jgi:hypothetical protein